MRRWTWISIFAMIMSATLAVGLGAAVSLRATPNAQPRLVVLIIFDQLRGDYLDRWASAFGERGFRRLERDGAWFTNCHYSYAGTETGPGHASIVTGCFPSVHGIIANDWYDRAAGELAYCVTADRFETVRSIAVQNAGASGGDDDDGRDSKAAVKRVRGGAPVRLLAPTVADAIQTASRGQAKIASIAMKDRSAILMGGQQPTACYWFDFRTGTFCTSTYYRDAPAEWVRRFNSARPAERWFGRVWDRARPDLDYEALSGPDDVVGEGLGVQRCQGRTFPHLMTAGRSLPCKAYFDTLYASPFGNELLLEFVWAALDGEQLGHHAATDLLCVSFASNDSVGHIFGPDSQEVLDMTIRSDQILGELLDGLDERFGRGQYAIVLSSDHGVCPLPEVSRQRGIAASRVDPDDVQREIRAALNARFGVHDDKAAWLDKIEFPWFYLNRRYLAARGLSATVVGEALADWLREQPWVVAAMSREQLSAPTPPQDAWTVMMARSFVPDRSGDVAAVIRPYYLFHSQRTGTGHGSPHPYDTHVPLMVLGPGVPVGRFDEPVTPLAAAVIGAKLAGAPAPAKATVDLPKSLQLRRN